MLNKSLTVRQDLSIATRMQIIGMNNAGLSGRAIGRQLRWNHIVISHLVRQYQQTNDVKDRTSSGPVQDQFRTRPGPVQDPSRTSSGPVQDNLVKHLHEKTGRRYDLFDGAPCLVA